MCLLNCILISIVTLTHSLPPPQAAQSTQMTLSRAIEEHPKFHDTLLNPAVVPFVNDWKNEKLNSKQKILSGSYFEMIKKLDDSNVDGLTTLADFNKAMSVYNQTQIDDFCPKFPGYIPKDQTKYPESYKLMKHVSQRCEILCADETDIDNIVVQPICRVFAIGYQLSDGQSSVPLSGGPVKNATINQAPVVNSRKLEPFSNSKLDAKTNDSSSSNNNNVNQGHEASLSAVHVNDIEKQVVDIKAPKEKTVEEFDRKFAIENSSPNEPGLASEVSQKAVNAESDAKASIVSTSDVNQNPTPTSKSEPKPSAEKAVNPSENPNNNPQTAEKPALEVGPSLLDQNHENDDDPVNNNDEDSTNVKGVTEDNENFDESQINNNKDKFANINTDDSNENEENIDDEMVDLEIAPAKSSPNQSPSNDQLHNEEDPFTDDTDSNFFAYFMFLLLVCVIAYVVYHNKSKMLALMLEGRRSSTNGRGGLSRRKHTAAYRKLDSNLEEAITSSANGRSTQVIY